MKTAEELAEEWRYHNCNHREFVNIKDAGLAAEKVVEAFKAGFVAGMDDQLWPASQKIYLDKGPKEGK